jgi:ferrous iron transport protein B
MAAREVVIAALGVIYAMSGDEDTVTQTLLSQISGLNNVSKLSS